MLDIYIYEICCCCWVASVVSDCVRPHRRQPTRLPHPWDSPGKNTGVSCHFLLQCMKVKSDWVILHCVYVPQLSYLSICWWTSRLLPCPGYYKQCCNEHWGTRVSFKWSHSVMSNSATPWTAAYQAPPSMRFSRQEYWSWVAIAFSDIWNIVIYIWNILTHIYMKYINILAFNLCGKSY